MRQGPVHTLIAQQATSTHHVYGLVIALSLISGLAGCVKPGVRPTSYESSYQHVQRSALSSRTQPSEDTVMWLRQRNLLKEWKGNPQEFLQNLTADIVNQVPAPRDDVAALAELCYIEARRAKATTARGQLLFATATVLSYAYLFDAELVPAVNPMDPAYRRACDIYNLSLARIMERSFESKELWHLTEDLPTLLGDIALPHQVEFYMPDLPGDYLGAETVYGYAVEGLDNHHRDHGLGVPLIILKDTSRHGHRVFMPIQAYPATVLLRPSGSLSRWAAEQKIAAQLEYYDTLKYRQDNEDEIPLEADLTTPMAYMLDRAPDIQGLEGLLNADTWNDMQGLYVLEPITGDKIPLVLVHGLLSSPMTWTQVVNDILGDHELRKTYQIWVFLYPTSRPVVYSAHTLRANLNRVYQMMVDADNVACFDEMVLVGHSMGGLLSRLMVQPRDDSLWSDLLDTSIEDQAYLDEEQKKLLEDVFYYDPLDFVKTVIFVATPHRGSVWADGMIASLGKSMIRSKAQDLSVFNADSLEQKLNSISDLSPDSSFVAYLNRSNIPESVLHDSIIADSKGKDRTGGTDTIVPYHSSHLDDARSEIVVHGKHGCTSHPDVIRQLRHLLAQHREAALERGTCLEADD